MVRGSKRSECSVAARLEIGESCRAQVEFADATAIDVTVVDYSAGGLGVRLGQFLPQGCVVRVRVEDSSGEVVQVGGRVQRISMIDRVPTYYAGLSFVEDDTGAERMLTSIRLASKE